MSEVPVIERQLSAEEKREVVEIGKPDVYKKMRKLLNNKEQEYVKASKPFCACCATIDYMDEIERVNKEVQRMNYGAENFESPIFDRIKIDFDKYGEAKRFEKVGEKMEYAKVLVGVVQQQSYPVGKTIDYRCKIRGCGRSVFIPITQKELEAENVK